MKAADIQKVLVAMENTASEALDHMANRFSGAVDKLGDEYAPLAEFSDGWAKLSKRGRKLFVQQLLKSTGLVLASAAATKAGLTLAGKTQKQIRRVFLGVADMIEPAAKRSKKKLKKK